MGKVKVGTASWTDRTLLDSGWYPASANTAEKRLAYYAEQYPLVEVDATYYAPPAEQTAALWASRTPAGFTFNIKAFSLLTGHPTRVSALPKDLRPDTDKATVYPKDVPPQTYEDVWSRFLSALDPLVDAGARGVGAPDQGTVDPDRADPRAHEQLLFGLCPAQRDRAHRNALKRRGGDETSTA